MSAAAANKRPLDNASEEQSPKRANTTTTESVMERVKLPDASVELYYQPRFLDKSMYEAVRSEVPWAQEKGKVFGKDFDQPRLTCFLGFDPEKSYTYSGFKRNPHPMTPTLVALTKLVQAAVHRLYPNHPLYTSVLANYYRDGNDYIGSHADNEKDLVPGAIIASLSLGETRHFDIHYIKPPTQRFGLKGSHERVKRIDLTDGSLLLMGRRMQQVFKHGIPREANKPNGRINLTWRVVKDL